MDKLYKGLYTDCLLNDQPKGTWPDARNIVLYKKRQAISNENGLDNISPSAGGAGTTNFPSKPVIGSFATNDARFFFFGTTNPADSEMGRIKSDGLYYPIIKDAILNFNQNFPIQATFEDKFNNNTIVAWTDFNDYPKILNVDCIPFGINPTTFAVVTADIPKAIAFLRQSSPFNTPIIAEYFLQVREGQGGLLSGGYYPAVKYELLDGTVSSWSKIYNGVPIIQQSLAADADSVNGCLGGITTNNAIEITFSNIDTNYKSIYIGYIYVKNGETFAYQESKFPITSSTLKVLITGANQTQITLDEMLVPNAIYKQVKSVTNLQQRLYYGNVVEDLIDLQYQTFANLITVKWVRDRDVQLNDYAKSIIDTSGNMVTNGSYQDGTKTFFDKSFKAGEVVALYIAFNLKNGNKSKSYLISGRAPNAGDKNVLNTAVLPAFPYYNKIDNGNPIYKYQIHDTTVTASAGDRFGSMGFWENENEQYPVDPNNPTTAVHPDFANIPGISFANRNVRHHVFPDVSVLGVGNNPDKYLEATHFSTSSVDPTTNLHSKGLGLQIANVNIPAGILALVDSWEIFYAKRDSTSIRVLASEAIFNGDGSAGAGGVISGTEARTYPFDFMSTRTSTFPTYLKLVQVMDSTNFENMVEYVFQMFDPIGFGFTPEQTIANVLDCKYIGENTTSPIDNSERADTLYIKFAADALFINTINYAATSRYKLADFCIYRRNVYSSFQDQTLVSTGENFKITASGVQATKKVYGGDVYLNRHTCKRKSDSAAAGHYPTNPSSFIVESASNIGLRYDDLALGKFSGPKTANPSSSWYGYNTDFNLVNTFIQPGIYFPAENCTDIDVASFFNRVAFSLQESSENKAINWRVFKANSFYDMPRNKGEIWNILGNDRILFIHLKYSLFIAEIKDKLASSTEEVFLGVSDIFDRPPQEALTVAEGFAGTQSQFACILCRIGYCFIDKKAGKVFVFKIGKGLVEVSDQGMYNFFQNNSEVVSPDIDNPFIGKGYMMGYDDALNRLIISKTDTSGFKFCLSYSQDLNGGQGGWISFHDYYPNVMVYDRTGFYSIDNSQFKIFKHNSLTKKAKYYDGTTKNSYVDYVENIVPDISRRFDNISWVSNSELNLVTYAKETFTHLIVYNETQCSGLIVLNLNVTDWFSKAARRVEGQFNFNDFRDLVKDVTQPFFDANNQLISGNIDSNKPWFNKSKFIGNFLVFRLITDNTTQHNLHLTLVGSNFIQ